jgi:hypothetical protein
MRDSHPPALHDWSADELRIRGKHARQLLRQARQAIGTRAPNAALHCVDAVLDEIEPILSSFQPRASSAVDAAVRGLTATARWTLREAIDEEREAHSRLARMLGEAPPEEVDRALARVEEQEAVFYEFSGLLAVFDRAYRPPSSEVARAV